MRDINRDLSLMELKYNENVLGETNGSFIVIDSRGTWPAFPMASSHGRRGAQSMK